MPAKTTFCYKVQDGLAMLEVTSSDPRRGGRVDSAIFEACHLDIIKSKKWCVRDGAIYSSRGESFSAIMGHIHGASHHVEDAEIFTKDTYEKRKLPSGAAEKAIAKIKEKAEIRRKSIDSREMLPKMRYKSQKDVSEVSVFTQKGIETRIKINNFMVGWVPKHLIMGQDGLHIRSKKDPTMPGILLATHLLNKLGQVFASRKVVLSDPYNLVYDVDACSFEANKCNKNRYYECGDITVLEIELRNTIDAWSPVEAGYRFPSVYYLNAPVRYVWVAFDTKHLNIMRQSEYDWTAMERNGQMDIFCDDGATIVRLKKVLARWSGMNVDGYIRPARFSKTYQRAIDENNLALRAKYDNMTNEEKIGNLKMMLPAKKVSFSRVHIDKTVFVPEMHGGCGQICLDMRAQSIRVGGSEVDG